MAKFEQAFADRGIALLAFPRRSPKLNAHAGRANLIHAEELYEVTDAEATLVGLRHALLSWERVCVTVGPTRRWAISSGRVPGLRRHRCVAEVP